MSNQKILSTMFLGAVIALLSNSANAASVYTNNASVLNINMVSTQMMSFAHNSDNLSDFFNKMNEYGTMNRLNEYGGEGFGDPDYYVGHQPKGELFQNIWAGAKHINADAHYSNNHTNHIRYDVFGFGATTKDLKLSYGNLAFGGFGAYIMGDTPEFDTRGNSMGAFVKYNYKKFDATVLVDNGSVNNKIQNIDFNNSWFNVAMDSHIKLKIDDTFYFQPGVYAGYTWISSDNLYIAGQAVTSKNAMFFNVAPSARFVKNIGDNWFGALHAKYVATFDKQNDIYVNTVKTDGISVDNYTQIGMDLEYNYKDFVFAGSVQKQLGGFDSWIGDITVKYLF